MGKTAREERKGTKELVAKVRAGRGELGKVKDRGLPEMGNRDRVPCNTGFGKSRWNQLVGQKEEAAGCPLAGVEGSCQTIIWAQTEGKRRGGKDKKKELGGK